MRQQILVLGGVFAMFFSTHSVSLAATCSELASHIDDIYAPTIGVSEESIDLKRAEKACLLEANKRKRNGNVNFNLARIYFLKKNSARGISYLKKSLNDKYPFAFYIAGVAHSEGVYLDKNRKLSEEYFQRAHNLGIRLSTFELGLIKLYSTNKKEISNGISLLEQAAFAGVHQASFQIGFFFEKVQKNIEMALRWYRRGADAGNIFSILRLSTIYSLGVGVPVDLKIANGFTLEAAKLGHTKSQVKVGVIFLKGHFVMKNRDIAKYWLRKALKSGSLHAERILLENTLNP